MKYKEIVLFILNNNNQVLLLKRSEKEKYNANKWSVLAGHVEDFDLTIEDAVLREIREELGIVLSSDKLYLIDIKDEMCETKFYYTYINRYEDEFILQKEEVTSVKWYDINEVIVMMENKDASIISSVRILKILKEFHK